MVVGDDVARLVDHEAGAEGALDLALRQAERVAEERARGQLDLRRRGDLNDSGRVVLVDLAQREPLRALLGGDVRKAPGLLADQLADGGRALPDTRQRADRHGHAAAGEGRDEQSRSHRQGVSAHPELHGPCIAEASLTELCAFVKERFA